MCAPKDPEQKHKTWMEIRLEVKVNKLRQQAKILRLGKTQEYARR